MLVHDAYLAHGEAFCATLNVETYLCVLPFGSDHCRVTVDHAVIGVPGVGHVVEREVVSVPPGKVLPNLVSQALQAVLPEHPVVLNAASLAIVVLLPSSPPSPWPARRPDWPASARTLLSVCVCVIGRLQAHQAAGSRS